MLTPDLLCCASQDVVVVMMLFFFDPERNVPVYVLGFAGFFTFMFLAMFTEVFPMSVFVALQTRYAH